MDSLVPLVPLDHKVPLVERDQQDPRVLRELPEILEPPVIQEIGVILDLPGLMVTPDQLDQLVMQEVQV